MNLKPTLLAAAIAVAGGALAIAPAALATPLTNGDGLITFNGEVTATTCTINSGNPDLTVNLPTVSTNSLTTGKTAGQTQFQINLSGCSPESGAAYAYFEQSPDIDAATGNLKNSDPAPATNVEVQLLDASLTPIVLNGDQTANPTFATITNGNATLTYYARYYATADASAGGVMAKVEYTIAYQ